MDAVAVAARNLVERVLAGGPEGQIAIAAMAGEADGGLLAGNYGMTRELLAEAAGEELQA